MSRPFQGHSIEQLEGLVAYSKASKDQATLDLVAKELEKYRNTQRAKQLLDTILLEENRQAPSSKNVVGPGMGRAGQSTGPAAAVLISQPARKPTPEQQQAIDLFLGRGSLKINAYAGTGKTSTLEMLAHATPSRGQYIAFNKSIVAEAKQRFPSTVDCATTHSMAFKATPSAYKANIVKMTGKVSANELAEILKLKKNWRVDEDHTLQPRSQAFLILETIKRFAQSEDDEPRASHVPSHGSLITADEATLALVRDFAVRGAQHVWNRMLDPADSIPLGHDGYLKLWALSKPQIAAEFILLDEAQDTNPVVLGVLKAQPCQMIYVGDRYQQIYEWRGAVNAMERIETDAEARLTQSFRFGSAIASGASVLLKMLGENVPLAGNPSLNSRIGSVDPEAILARSNASVMSALIGALNAGKRPHLVGGGDDLKRMLKGVQELKEGRPAADVAEFFGFQHWREVIEFAKTTEGEHLQTFVSLIDTHGERQLLWALNRTSVEQDSDLIISTAHKAKGREWSKVQLMDDFLKSSPKPTKDQLSAAAQIEADRAAELRLFYVAMTRAKQVIDIPPPLLSALGMATDQVAKPKAISVDATNKPVSSTPRKASASIPTPKVQGPWSPPVDWEAPSAPRPTSEPARPSPPSSPSVTKVDGSPKKKGLLSWIFGR